MPPGSHRRPEPPTGRGRRPPQGGGSDGGPAPALLARLTCKSQIRQSTAARPVRARFGRAPRLAPVGSRAWLTALSQDMGDSSAQPNVADDVADAPRSGGRGQLPSGGVVGQDGSRVRMATTACVATGGWRRPWRACGCVTSASRSGRSRWPKRSLGVGRAWSMWASPSRTPVGAPRRCHRPWWRCWSITWQPGARPRATPMRCCSGPGRGDTGATRTGCGAGGTGRQIFDRPARLDAGCSPPATTTATIALTRREGL
jgi:hypothetical protein